MSSSPVSDDSTSDSTTTRAVALTSQVGLTPVQGQPMSVDVSPTETPTQNLGAVASVSLMRNVNDCNLLDVPHLPVVRASDTQEDIDMHAPCSRTSGSESDSQSSSQLSEITWTPEPRSLVLPKGKAAVCVDVFPAGSPASYDHDTLSCGLFVHHKYHGPSDVFGHIGNDQTVMPAPGTHVDLSTITAWVLNQLRRYPDLRSAQTVLVLSDTRKLETIDHWKHTSRFIVERTLYHGPNQDDWFVLFVPSDKFQAHYVWTTVFVLRALSCFLPYADLLLWDHDAAPLCLFEVSELVSLAQNACLPFRFPLKSIGAILCTEHNSSANAGIVIFPRLVKGVAPDHLFADASRYMSFLLQTSSEETLRLLVKTVEVKLGAQAKDLAARKQPLHFRTTAVWAPPGHETDKFYSPEEEVRDTLRKHTALDWNLEAEYSILNHTPFHRSMALSRHDLILLWAALGQVMHLTCFPASHLRLRNGFPGNLRQTVQNRTPSVVKWAGPPFEQTCLQALYAIQSEFAVVTSLPGHKLFMATILPGDLNKWLPPPCIHGYGKYAKEKLKELNSLLTFFTLEEVLTPQLVPGKEQTMQLLPYFLSPDGFQPVMGALFDTPKLPSYSCLGVANKQWSKVRAEPLVCEAVKVAIRAVSSAWPPLTRFAPPNVKRETLEVPADSSALQVCCPGLRCSGIEGFTPHVLLMNKGHSTSYGPTGLLAEEMNGVRNNLAFFPSETLHALILLLKDPAFKDAWSALEYESCTYSEIAALPSFFHLPSDAYMVAVALCLSAHSTSPHTAIQRLLGHQAVEGFEHEPVPVDVAGFSAGSYSGFLVYRLLMEKGHLLNLRFNAGILGGLCFHPIMFYDFWIHDGRAPLRSEHSFTKSIAVNQPRPILIQVTTDKLTPYNPSDEEANGIRSLNYPLLLLQVPEDSHVFGRNKHAYSQLLEPVLKGKLVKLSHVTLHELIDVSTPSDKLFAMLMALVSVFGVNKFRSFIENLVVASPLLDPTAASQWSPGNLSPADTFWSLICAVKYEGQLLDNMKPTFDTLMAPIPLQLQAWLLFFAIPSSFARHIQATQDRQATGSMVAVHKCSTSVVPASCHVSSVIGHSAARLVFSFQCSADTPGWANFFPMAADGTISAKATKGKGKSKSVKGKRHDYASQGLRIGDVVRFQLTWADLNLPGVSCIGVVLSKSVYQTKSERQRRIKHLDKISSVGVLVSIMPEDKLQLETLHEVITRIARGNSRNVEDPAAPVLFGDLSTSSLFHHIAQHPSCVTTGWKKLQSSLMPIEWSGLLNIPMEFLPMVFCPMSPATIAVDLARKVTATTQPEKRAFSSLRTTLQLAISQLGKLSVLPDEQVTFGYACHAYGLDPSSPEAAAIIDCICEHFSRVHRQDYSMQDMLIDTPLVINHFWIAVAWVCSPFATDLAKALLDQFEVTLAFLSHICIHGVSGRLCALVQGVVGSGKTYTCNLLVFLAVVFCNLKILWVSHNNKPLEEAADHFQYWLGASPRQIKETLSSKFRRLPAGDQIAKFDLVDVSFEERGDCQKLDWPNVHVLLVTTTALVSSCQLPFAEVWSFLRQGLNLAIVDEAQQFPDATDAWLLTLSETPPLFVLVGDQQQPAGASNVPFAQALLKVQLQLRGGLHNPSMLARPPGQYLQQVKLFDPVTGDHSVVASFREVLQALGTGLCLEAPNSHAELLGLASPGALLLPVSARVPNEVYQPIVLSSYPRSLLEVTPTPVKRAPGFNSFALNNTIQVKVGLPCLLDILPPSLRGIRVDLPASTDFTKVLTYDPRTRAIDTYVRSTNDFLKQGSNPAPPTARLSSHHLRYGIYIVPYVNKNAASQPKNNSERARFAQEQWIHEATEKTIAAFAMFIHRSLSVSHRERFKLGFFCPWRVLHDAILHRFGAQSVLDDSQSNSQTLLEAVQAALGTEVSSNIALSDVLTLLRTQPQTIGKYVIVGTSISSASANVRHAVVFVPKYTEFASAFDQSLVAISRVQGLLLLFTNPTCLQGYFRLAVPLFIKQHGLVHFKGTDPADLLESLKKASPPVLSPTEVTNSLGINVSAEFDIRNLPLGLVVQVCRFDQTQCFLLQLMVTHVSPYAKCKPMVFLALSEEFAWCWRQCEPFMLNQRVFNSFIVLRGSTANNNSVFTLYVCKGGMSMPCAIFDSLQSINGVLLPSKNYCKNTSFTIRQATPSELLGHDSHAGPLFAMPHSDVVSDQPQEVEDDSLDLVDEGADVTVEQTEEAYPGFDFSFDSTSGLPSISYSGRTTGTTASSALLTQDEDEDQMQDQDISELLEVVKAINENSDDTEKLSSETLLEVASLTTPCCWAVLRVVLDKCNMEFSNVLFVHGLLVKHDDNARTYLPIIGDYENAYCHFLASIIVQMLLPLRDYKPYDCVKGMQILDQLTSTAFWKRQLVLASRTDTSAVLKPYQLMQGLPYRTGRAMGSRPKFQRFCDDAWAPLNALVLFLPMQLALFLTVKCREFVASQERLTDMSAYPSVVMDTDAFSDPSGKNRQGSTQGRAFKGCLKVDGPPLWPQHTGTFPFTIPDSARAAISAFINKRTSYNYKDLRSLKAQVNLDSRLMYLKFHLAELPAQIDLGHDTRTQQYTSVKSQSGPFSLQKRICNEYAQEELERLTNFDVLAHNAESVLVGNVDRAFPIDEHPCKKQKVKSDRSGQSAGSQQTRSERSQTNSQRSWSSSSWKDSKWVKK